MDANHTRFARPFRKVTVPHLLAVSRFVLCLSVLAFVTGLSAAEHDHHGKGRLFKAGEPIATTDLPPGRLRQQLDLLPAAQRDKALVSLSRLTFHENDLESLHVNANGAAAAKTSTIDGLFVIQVLLSRSLVRPIAHVCAILLR